MWTSEDLYVHQYNPYNYLIYQKGDTVKTCLPGSVMGVYVDNYGKATLESVVSIPDSMSGFPLQVCFSNERITDNIIDLYNKFEWV